MKRDWTDAKFEVVSPPTRKELPQWFKTGAVWLPVVLGLALALGRAGAFGDLDQPPAAHAAP